MKTLYKTMANGERRRLTPKRMAAIASWPPERFHAHDDSPDLIAVVDPEGACKGGRLVVVSVGVPHESWARMFTWGAM